ncbi:hypothetical protein Ahy_B02g059007 [Arachis hypogaea]|uniref:Aminotransferase-like plant mobile domain-containing protein n=1 Tax=Arachis hypogaea TaxID=3818 RepID=A0A445AFZ2_ARAHY|nr:hypothetical protein Ahy_B02g059007 [Arachis hypogaea]
MVVILANVHRLIGMTQQSRDQHEQRVLQWRQELDQLLWNEITQTFIIPVTDHSFTASIVVHVDAVRRLCTAGYLLEAEWGTWMSVVPLVCFSIVEFYHANWVKRQFNGEQLMPGDLINVDKFLTTIGQGEDVWWPTNLRE